MKDMENVEAHAMPDHIHMLLKFPQHVCILTLWKKFLMMYDRHVKMTMRIIHFVQKAMM